MFKVRYRDGILRNFSLTNEKPLCDRAADCDRRARRQVGCSQAVIGLHGGEVRAIIESQRKVHHAPPKAQGGHLQCCGSTQTPAKGVLGCAAFSRRAITRLPLISAPPSPHRYHPRSWHVPQLPFNPRASSLTRRACPFSSPGPSTAPPSPSLRHAPTGPTPFRDSQSRNCECPRQPIWPAGTFLRGMPCCRHPSWKCEKLRSTARIWEKPRAAASVGAA